MILLQDFGIAFCAVLLESAPLVVLGFVIAGLLHEFVPPARLRKGAGGRGLKPVSRAVATGALLPICSCSTIPLGIGLTRSGASTGTALAFMTSSPAISPVTLILGWGVLGPALLGWYSAAVVAGALLLGLVGNRLLKEAAAAPATSNKCGCGCGSKPSTGGRLARAMHWAFGELGVEVSGSLVVGLLAASAILVALPEGLVAGWLHEPSWLALAAAIALALPAYTCSVPSLMIAGSLLARGVDPGVAVAFLIAGPATNLGELNAIRHSMGWRSAVFYASSLILIALAAGAATALLPASLGAVESAHAGHTHTHALDSVITGAGELSIADFAWWRWPFAFGIAAMALRAGIGFAIRLPLFKPRSTGAQALYGVAAE
ncbi:MAG: permease [Planctomycetota bacterium]